MLRNLGLHLIFGLLAICAGGCWEGGVVATNYASQPAYTPGGPPAQPLRYTLSGPYSSNNLSLFLVHHDQADAAANYLTLQEAMRQKKVVVDETGHVNVLTIENRGSSDVFIHSGEIVKGGRQDRTIAEDQILQHQSGRVPLDSFCVEPGRWSRRGWESDSTFSGSTWGLASKDLKLAARLHSNQREVWDRVAQMQQALGRVLRDAAINAPSSSSSSLQLTLENPELVSLAKEYTQSLGEAPQVAEDVVGYVALINGSINSAEIYGNNSLFRAAWPKLLNALAVEAISHRNDASASPPAGQEQVRAFVSAAESGSPATRELNSRTRVAKYESATAVLFETYDQGAARWVHRSYFMK